jgi:CubicO group peptidase (beta-lactamase class C family)
MPQSSIRTRVAPRGSRGAVQRLGLALGVAVLPIVLAGQTAPGLESKVDAVFAKWNSSTPGCAVGAAIDGTPVLAKGYGMADLEHDIRITPDSILEAGSISKQFTAAAVMLLARDGKLSLDDQARKYIPELPGYPPSPGASATGSGEAGVSLTIRHMLTHTSGLRDWGNVAGIAGWPRTTRVHTHAHVLEIVARQKALNFAPGTHWSYSNTGFNLAAIIVERVSGKTLQEFTRTRLFEPLGMTHTSWRDDYTRIVKGRALAYAERGGAFHTDMPFENVYGNGGLLTTVGDLLKWNGHYDAPSPADAAITAEQQQPGRFNDGRTLGYALGLFVGTYKGLREVYHSGSTAGYSAFLTRFPDQKLSVAVLCNATTANATQYAHAVADLYLGDRLKPAAPAPTPTAAELDAAAGLYRSLLTGVAVTIGRDKATLRGRRWTFDGRGGAIAGDESAAVSSSMTPERYERVTPASYTDEQLAALAGTYVSDEAETVLTAVVENHALVLRRRPDVTIKLTPTYANAFTADHGLGTVIFDRDTSGRVTELSVVQDRVWNLRFARTPAKH